VTVRYFIFTTMIYRNILESYAIIFSLQWSHIVSGGYILKTQHNLKSCSQKNQWKSLKSPIKYILLYKHCNMYIYNVFNKGYPYNWGHVVVLFVEALCYKPEGHRIESQWGGFFNWPNPSSHTMAPGSTQPLTEMSTRYLPGGKGQPARKADNLTAICELIV
jgi:hypothetical protein